MNEHVNSSIQAPPNALGAPRDQRGVNEVELSIGPSRGAAFVPGIAGAPEPAQSPVTDKQGFGRRWGFSTRQVDNFLGQGMPHLKIGKRRVRIVIAEADAWMHEKFATRRLASRK